jgi:hypothetical protein
VRDEAKIRLKQAWHGFANAEARAKNTGASTNGRFRIAHELPVVLFRVSARSCITHDHLMNASSQRDNEPITQLPLGRIMELRCDASGAKAAAHRQVKSLL